MFYICENIDIAKMSRDLLINLRDYLLEALSEEDAVWLGASLSKQKPQELEDDGFSLDNMPFVQTKTKREMVEEGERQIAERRCYSTDELIKICEDRLMSVAV